MVYKNRNVCLCLLYNNAFSRVLLCGGVKIKGSVVVLCRSLNFNIFTHDRRVGRHRELMSCLSITDSWDFGRRHLEGPGTQNILGLFLSRHYLGSSNPIVTFFDSYYFPSRSIWGSPGFLVKIGFS